MRRLAISFLLLASMYLMGPVCGNPPQWPVKPVEDQPLLTFPLGACTTGYFQIQGLLDDQWIRNPHLPEIMQEGDCLYAFDMSVAALTRACCAKDGLVSDFCSPAAGEGGFIYATDADCSHEVYDMNGATYGGR